MRVIRHFVMLAGITTVPQTAIFNESSTLIFSAITRSIPVIFSHIALKLMRILRDKNYQNWFSGFGEICFVLFLRSDRYSVPRPTTILPTLWWLRNSILKISRNTKFWIFLNFAKLRENKIFDFRNIREIPNQFREILEIFWNIFSKTKKLNL